MKKLSLVIAFLLLTTATFATTKAERKDDVKKIAYNALQNFEADFKTAKDVSWKVNDQYIKGSFTSDGKKMAGLYGL